MVWIQWIPLYFDLDRYFEVSSYQLLRVNRTSYRGFSGLDENFVDADILWLGNSIQYSIGDILWLKNLAITTPIVGFLSLKLIKTQSQQKLFAEMF